MKINFAHIRERSTSGGWINFAVFEANSTSGSDSANAQVLADLTNKTQLAGYKIDQSALAFMRQGRLTFYGTKNLVDYLSKQRLPSWTHSITV
ncbi:hypothetical protein [Polaromonas naphthalenivorans]|uniref:Uncharacterized protein n=1 Tax=Polaromonas naphthalenivorans (strain CJ2) TaxID=365044 RepID=A1VX15_POLNA|nr:hypothetical protein [Polaromonas naphthalenivorans]ABM40193.1 conserved hypothetical protein [Polaromonas naphthalenivorans CJ2]